MFCAPIYSFHCAGAKGNIGQKANQIRPEPTTVPTVEDIEIMPENDDNEDDVNAIRKVSSVVVVQPTVIPSHETVTVAVVKIGDETAIGVNADRHLFDVYPEAALSRERFEQFRRLVEQDLEAKLAHLQDYRRRCATASAMRDRNYANIQIFMLNKYAGRLRRFHVICETELTKLETHFRDGARNEDDFRPEVERYTRLVSKLSRRMKHILDVSEKYAALEIFEGLCEILAETAKERSSGGSRLFKRSFHSMDGINTSFTDSEGSSASSSSSAPAVRSCSPVLSVSSLPNNSPTPSGSPVLEEPQLPSDGEEPCPAAFPTPPSSPELMSPAPTAAFAATMAAKSKSAPADCRQQAAAVVNAAAVPVDPRQWRASSLQSLTDHLSVLGKTFTNRR